MKYLRSNVPNLRQLRKASLKKNYGLNGIRTHDLCDTGVVLYQLSYQAKWELDFTIYGYITKSLSEQLMIDLQSLFEDILSSCAPRESTTF